MNPAYVTERLLAYAGRLGPLVAGCLLLSVTALLVTGCHSPSNDDDNDDVTEPTPADDDDVSDNKPLEFPLQVEVRVSADGLPIAGVSVLEGGGKQSVFSDEQGQASLVLQGIVADEVWVISLDTLVVSRGVARYFRSIRNPRVCCDIVVKYSRTR